MIELAGSTDKVYDEVYTQILDIMKSSDEATPAADWAWERHAASAGRPGREHATFTFDGDWNDLVDNYYEAQFDNWSERQIG